MVTKCKMTSCANYSSFTRSSCPKVFCKKGVLKNAFRPTTLLKRDSNTGGFFGRFCEVSQKAFFIEHPQVVVSELQKKYILQRKMITSIDIFCSKLLDPFTKSAVNVNACSLTSFKCIYCSL